MDQDIRIELIKKEDENDVIEHLHKFFCEDEPILKHLEVGITTEFDDMFRKYISQGLSLKAVNSSGEIVGVFLSNLVKKSEQEKVKFPATGAPSSDHKIRIVNGILDHMEGRFDVFAMHPHIDSYLDGTNLSVDAKYRGTGVATKLANSLIELCREKHIPFIRIVCSNSFTRKICINLGLKVACEVPYYEINLEDLPSITMPEPHTHACVAIKDFTC